MVKLANTKCINDDIKRAFLFACFTGLRFSDLGNLTWEMIHFDGKRYKLAFRQKKTRGYEYFPLPETAIKLLFNNQDNIINLPHNRVFKVHDLNWYNKVLKKWAREAGINKHMSSHVGRHTFATLALSQGVDIYTVSKLLGHKSLNHTQIYAKIIDEKKNEAVDLLPKIEVI